jgi:hypothetical protein
VRRGDPPAVGRSGGGAPAPAAHAALAGDSPLVMRPAGNVLIPRGVVDRLGGGPDYNGHARVARAAP